MMKRAMSVVSKKPAVGESGQMTAEMAVAMPALIVVAVIAVNACTFFYQCAVFDRVAHEAVRVYAASPAYGEGSGQACASVEQTVRSQLDDQNLDVSVAYAKVGADFDEYRVTLGFHPTLFGMGLRSEVFGASMPQLEHTLSRIRAGDAAQGKVMAADGRIHRDFQMIMKRQPFHSQHSTSASTVRMISA